MTLQVLLLQMSFLPVLGLNSSKWQQALIDKGLATYAAIQYQTLKYVGPVSMISWCQIRISLRNVMKKS